MAGSAAMARESGQDHVVVIDPLRDSRWPKLVEEHPAASVFHTRPWLQSLRTTYGYEPVAFTTAQPSEPLRCAVVFCLVKSWLTGERLVSLPFSDHCEPLVLQSEEFNVLTRFVETLRAQHAWRYVQIRSANPTLNGGGYLHRAKIHCLHRLDLRPRVDDLYRRLHSDCIQRKIRRAERDRVVCEAGRSPSLLLSFYRLLCMTRARHGIPPQPIEWFQNLVAHMGSSLCLWVASKAGHPIAGILTLRHGKQMIYKYGGSDPTQTHHGGTVMLLWEAMKQAKQDGVESFDFGRSDLDHAGLIMFKARWAAESSILTTWEAPTATGSSREAGLTMRYTKELFSYLPKRMQTIAGRLLYRHIG